MTSGSWPRERRFLGVGRPRLPRRPRALHIVALVLVVAAVGWLGWLWFRSSSLVRVRRVSVVGLSGPDVPRIRAALTSAALRMTTLTIDQAKLDAAVSRYPVVRTLTVTTRGAHDVVIHVGEQVPVARVDIGGAEQIIDADGQLLPRSAGATGSLPLIPLQSAPVSGQLTAPGARAAVAVLAAAPYALLAHITEATPSVAHGVIVQLRDGPALYFGPDAQLAQKWNAAVAVLQSHWAAGAGYIDLSDPQRPAPGVIVSKSRQSSST